MPALYLATGHAAGDECSSTYEGRHLTLEESYLTHPTHADGFVDGGDPVVFRATVGNGVGVAFKSAAAATDLIALDTEGIWFLSAVAVNDAGNSAIATGDKIYINKTTAVLSKISDFETQLPFGYALGDVTSGATGVVAIKVHWDPLWWDLYHSNATATADDGVSITVVDTGSATGMGRALEISYRQDGVKANPGEVDGINVDMDLRKACTYAYGVAVYHSSSGNPVVGFQSCFSCYLDDVGTGAVAALCADLGYNASRDLADRHGFIRMRNHCGATPPDAALYFEGTPNADYFASWETVSLPVVAAAVGGAQTHKIRVRAQGVDYFIPLNTA